jgi:hypothetical protein
MTTSSASTPEVMKEAEISRADWIRLPLLSLLTIVLIATSTELIAGRMFQDSGYALERCMVMNDPIGPRGIPNTTCWGKTAEGPLVEYRFNNCGHRTNIECGSKPPGVYRIVMVGSSDAMGAYVQREKTVAALLPEELSQVTGLKVELYNEAMGGAFSHSADLRFNQALAANPDMILWLFTAIDVERASEDLHTANLDPYAGLSLPAKFWRKVRDALSKESFSVAAYDAFTHTRTSFLLRHFLWKSQSQYVKSYLMAPDSMSGFLRTELSPEWKMRLRMFDRDATDMERQATKAGVPFVGVLVPIRAQAAMISMGDWPEGYDPYRLGNDVRAIVTGHGGIYLDILPDFRNIPDAGQYFYPVDTHPDARANAIISASLTKALTNGSVPALKAPRQQLAVSEKSK